MIDKVNEPSARRRSARPFLLLAVSARARSLSSRSDLSLWVRALRFFFDPLRKAPSSSESSSTKVLLVGGERDGELVRWRFRFNGSLRSRLSGFACFCQVGSGRLTRHCHSGLSLSFWLGDRRAQATSAPCWPGWRVAAVLPHRTRHRGCSLLSASWMGGWRSQLEQTVPTVPLESAGYPW